METYSLLQTSLDQTIDRRSLEDASVAVPSVARADCARLQRELFGMVVSGLAYQEALAFQAELARRNFPTEVVADCDLPVLHESFQIQRIGCRGEVLVLTDSMGRERPRPLTDLVFLAAGFIEGVEFKTEVRHHFDFNPGDCRESNEPLRLRGRGGRHLHRRDQYRLAKLERGGSCCLGTRCEQV